ITVYTPFKAHRIQANQTVGILGLGGLGHLALQFANAFGCQTYAFSTSESKREEALRYGAVDLVGYGSSTFQKLAGHFDFLISTVSADLDWSQILKLLAPEGTLILVGASPKPLNIQASMLINGARKVAGSVIGNPMDISEMLAFCARSGVRPQIEVLPFAQVNQALDKVRQNQARYRMVLGWDVT
ncbi:MAG: zinc-binding dehydrogenase, partial [Acidobacteria bacterium]|nr:zinc-binding dehydrogenase [Acidobacteriota bacterium]